MSRALYFGISLHHDAEVFHCRNTVLSRRTCLRSVRRKQLLFRSTSTTPSSLAAYDSRSGIYTSDRPDILLPDDAHLDFVSFVLSGESLLNNNVALVDGTSGRELTYSEVKKQVKAVATGLQYMGVNRGDVVMLLAGNSLLYPVTVMAIASVGAVVATPSPGATTEDIEFQANLCKPKLLITTKALLFKTQGLALMTVLMDDNGDDADEEASFTGVRLSAIVELSSTTEHLDLKPAINKDDVAAILFSSGTTGVSKAVQLSHGNIVSQLLQLNGGEHTSPSSDVALCALPMSHIFGLVAVTLHQLHLRNKLVIFPGFQLSALLPAVEKYQVSHIYLVPPVVVALTKLLQKRSKEYCLACLRAILCGAAPLGKKQVDNICSFVPNASFYQLFGITETSGALTINNTSESGNTATVGQLLSSVEAKVMDMETDQPLPPLRRGELLVRGPMRMIGYLKNPLATSLSITDDGWLRTGDLVFFDQGGSMYVVDRMKEMIKYKALQVAPAEIEAVLFTHPQILDAAVVPCKDEDAGEVPMAFVVPSDEELTEDEVKAFVANHVASHKRVRRVAFVDSIPKTLSGKILRKSLVSLLV